MAKGRHGDLSLGALEGDVVGLGLLDAGDADAWRAAIWSAMGVTVT
jgi:hypothetical protein